MSSFPDHGTKLQALVKTPLFTSLVLCGVPQEWNNTSSTPAPASTTVRQPSPLSASWVRFIQECKTIHAMGYDERQSFILTRGETEDTIENLVFLFAVATQNNVRFRFCFVLWL